MIAQKEMGFPTNDQAFVFVCAHKPEYNPKKVIKITNTPLEFLYHDEIICYSLNLTNQHGIKAYKQKYVNMKRIERIGYQNKGRG